MRFSVKRITFATISCPGITTSSDLEEVWPLSKTILVPFARGYSSRIKKNGNTIYFWVIFIALLHYNLTNIERNRYNNCSLNCSQESSAGTMSGGGQIQFYTARRTSVQDTYSRWCYIESTSRHSLQTKHIRFLCLRHRSKGNDDR